MLRSLLLVIRFFFNIVALLLYQNAMADWVNVDKTQLAATLFISAVHSLHSKGHFGSSNNSMELGSFWADQVMARFDLAQFTEDSINALVPSTINYAARMTQYGMS